MEQNYTQPTTKEQDNADQVSATNSPATNGQTPQKRQKKRTLLTIIIVIAILVIGIGGFYIWNTYSSSNEEQTAYEILENNDNPQDYEDYLQNFPNGKHADEVRERLAQLNAMLARWKVIEQSENVADFINFKNTYTDAQYGRLCDIKIDSLDFVKAQREGTEEAFERYLMTHPDGRYASEASVAQGQMRDAELSQTDRDQIMRVLTDFFKGFETQDENLICSNIAATMTTFLHQKNASKAVVMKTIKSMYNEHILNCNFVVNRDIEIERSNTSGNNDNAKANNGYRATFTVDQHIQRDNEGKTFGSYKCVAEISNYLLITSLTMEELSKQ